MAEPLERLKFDDFHHAFNSSNAYTDADFLTNEQILAVPGMFGPLEDELREVIRSMLNRDSLKWKNGEEGRSVRTSLAKPLEILGQTGYRKLTPELQAIIDTIREQEDAAYVERALKLGEVAKSTADLYALARFTGNRTERHSEIVAEVTDVAATRTEDSSVFEPVVKDVKGNVGLMPITSHVTGYYQIAEVKPVEKRAFMNMPLGDDEKVDLREVTEARHQRAKDDFDARMSA